MKLNVRIILAISGAILIIFYFFTDTILNKISPSYQSAVEESVNDTVHLLASFLETQIEKEKINTRALEKIFNKAMKRKFRAKIHDLIKEKISLSVYVVNKKGIVIYDSNKSLFLGKDFSRYNDIYLCLQGKYGARSSYILPGDEKTKSLIIAAPIYRNKKIIGAVSVAKRKTNIRIFIRFTKIKLILASILSLSLLILVIIFLLFIITRPISKLKNYVKEIKKTGSAKFPKLGNTEIKDLALTFEDLRIELEGKKYIEHYIQNLTHELKSPLSSIIGATEILCDDMDNKTRAKFNNNIKSEARRIEKIINKMLNLSKIESARELTKIEKIYVDNLINEIISGFLPQIEKRNLKVEYDINNNYYITGEKFLIRQAIANLIQNAINFSPDNSVIKIFAFKSTDYINIQIIDNGKGIPEYAINRIFDKFYSIPLNKKEKKGTGLGLPFVKQVAILHQGSINIKNNEGTGVTAELILPVNQGQP